MAFKLPESDGLRQEVQGLRQRLQEVGEQLRAFEVPEEVEEVGVYEMAFCHDSRWWKRVEG